MITHLASANEHLPRWADSRRERVQEPGAAWLKRSMSGSMHWTLVTLASPPPDSPAGESPPPITLGRAPAVRSRARLRIRQCAHTKDGYDTAGSSSPAQEMVLV